MEKYSKIKQLGKGSFGAAILVKRLKDGALFVVKEVSFAKMSSKEREEARHEVKILAQLNHPNITRYVEHIEKSGVLYIIMEFADGGDLYQLIKKSAATLTHARGNELRNRAGGAAAVVRKGPGGSNLSEATCLHYFSQLCLAIDYLHTRHILHRDIKTMNVFLTSTGVVKLGDFGISTILRNTIGIAKTVCGTPYYFSPELCRSKPYNNKSDVWSLGVVLYEVAMQKHPFEGSSMAMLMQRICRGQYAPLPSDNSPAAEAGESITGFTLSFRQLISGCLEVDVRRRYNIKHILSAPGVIGALKKLEKNLMLATVCKVRLQTIVGNYGQVDKNNAEQPRIKDPREKQEAPPQAPVQARPFDRYREHINQKGIPPPNKLGPKPYLGNVSPAPQPLREGDGRYLHNQQENIKLKREISKVDQLLQHMQVPQDNIDGTREKARIRDIIEKNKKDKETKDQAKEKEAAALKAYEDRHKQLKKMMADHKERLEENARKRLEKEAANRKSALEARKGYVGNLQRKKDERIVQQKQPNVEVPQIKKPSIQVKSDISQLQSPQHKSPVDNHKKYDISREVRPAKWERNMNGVAANCCTPKKNEYKKERRRGAKDNLPEESSHVPKETGGIEAHVEQRRHQEQDNQSPIPVVLRKEDMPAGVAARRQMYGYEDPLKVEILSNEDKEGAKEGTKQKDACQQSEEERAAKQKRLAKIVAERDAKRREALRINNEKDMRKDELKKKKNSHQDVENEIGIFEKKLQVDAEVSAIERDLKVLDHNQAAKKRLAPKSVIPPPQAFPLKYKVNRIKTERVAEVVCGNVVDTSDMTIPQMKIFPKYKILREPSHDYARRIEQDVEALSNQLQEFDMNRGKKHMAATSQFKEEDVVDLLAVNKVTHQHSTDVEVCDLSQLVATFRRNKDICGNNPRTLSISPVKGEVTEDIYNGVSTDDTDVWAAAREKDYNVMLLHINDLVRISNDGNNEAVAEEIDEVVQNEPVTPSAPRGSNGCRVNPNVKEEFYQHQRRFIGQTDGANMDLRSETDESIDGDSNIIDSEVELVRGSSSNSSTTSPEWGSSEDDDDNTSNTSCGEFFRDLVPLIPPSKGRNLFFQNEKNAHDPVNKKR